MGKCTSKPISTETMPHMINALVWPVATYGCESWTSKNKGKTTHPIQEVSKLHQETATNSMEMKGHKHISLTGWPIPSENY